MRYISILIILCSLLLTVSCATQKESRAVRDEVAEQYTEATPFKTLSEEVDGEIITGIGTSEERQNFSLMRDSAITSAQADLARKVEASVEAVWKRISSDWTEYKKKGKDEVMSIEEMKIMQKTIVDTELRGPWQIQELIDKKSGRYWVRILLQASTVEKWLLQKMEDESLLRKYIIETQIQKVQEDLQKDLDSVREREKAETEKLKEIIK